jgi:hypothetical protein
VAGIVLLAFSVFSVAGALRFLTGGFALLVAITGSAATVLLFWLGQKNHWTSDGPGMLFVMIALAVCAVAAVVGWISVFGVAATVAVPKGAAPRAPRAARLVFLFVGLGLLAVAALGNGIEAFMGRGRAAHSAPVVAVSFAGRSRLVTLDAGGTLVDWDVHSKREDRRQAIPGLAGASEMFLGDSADRGFAIANGKAVAFQPFRDTRVNAMADARHVTGGGTVVIARDRALVVVNYDDWTKDPRELAWPEPILAIAARDGLVAVADRASVSLVDGRPNSVRIHASTRAPAPLSAAAVLNEGTVLAREENGAVWAIDVRRATSEPLAAKAALLAAHKHVLFVWGREVTDYDPRTKAATRVGRIGPGARSMATWGDQVAFGFEGGEVVLGTLTAGQLETVRLTGTR